MSESQPFDLFAREERVLFRDGSIELSNKLERLVRLDQVDLRVSLETNFGRLRAVACWLLYGRNSYPTVAVALSEEAKKYAFQEATHSDVQEHGFPFEYEGLPRLLAALHPAHIDREHLGDPRTTEGREFLLGWFLTLLKDRFGRDFDRERSDLIERLDSEAVRTVGSMRMPVSRLMLSVWRWKGEVRAYAPPTMNTGCYRFMDWWLRYGRTEYGVERDTPAWLKEWLRQSLTFALDRASEISRGREIAPKTLEERLAFLACLICGDHSARLTASNEPLQLRVLSGPSPYAPGAREIGMSLAMHAYWYSRPDLMRTYDPDSEGGALGFVGWWLIHGPSECWWIRMAEWQAKIFDGPSGRYPPLTIRMAAVWQSRQDLREQFCVDNQKERLAFLGWWLYQMPSSPWSVIPDSLLQELLRPADSVIKGTWLTMAHIAVWLYRTDIQEAFDLETVDGQDAYAYWYSCCAPHLVWPEPCEPRIAVELGKALSGGLLHASVRWIYEEALNNRQPGGVQLIGWVNGALGIGEDVRCAAAAMEEAGAPYILLEATTDLVAQGAVHGRSLRIVDAPQFLANMTFLPAADHYRTVIKTPSDWWKGRYNIGVWPWELPSWPRGLEFVYDIVDEVWAATTFTQECFSASGKKPVVRTPPVVRIDTTPTPNIREELDLPEDAFVFLNIFDCNSSISRKNPEGVIRAFRNAFGYQQRDVRLVVKTMNAGSSEREWTRIVELGAGDPRILFIDEVYNRAKILGLSSACDVFVSLHRSEGFGRNIAEAMLLGKPVLVSAWSGNMDFTNPDNSYLVEGKLRSLEPFEYTYWPDQHWFEPSIDHAAELMRSAWDDREQLSKRAELGKRMVESEFSPDRVGARYCSRLAQLGIL
jgi:glycosyltransferase involved in cell wall biosynthesis